MAWWKREKKQKPLPYPVIPLERDGEMVQHVQIPLRDLMEYTMGGGGGRGSEARKQRLIQRIGSMFSREAIEQTSMAPDESTTDTGSAAKSDSAVAGSYYEQIRIEHKRIARLRDYERMDNEDTVLNRALDVRTENAYTSRDGDQESFEVGSDSDEATGRILEDVTERLKLHEQMPTIHRSALKYGDDMEERIYDNAHVLVRLKWLHPKYMRRNEDDYGRLIADRAFTMVDEAEEPIAVFEHWQVIHWRHNRKRGDLYGSSMMFPSRRPFRITHLMEDGIAINRLVRSTDKLAFYIPVPRNADQAEQQRIIEEVKQKFKRRSNIDAAGKLDLTKNPLGDDEDIFVGTWEGSPAKVERLAIGGVISKPYDLEHFENQKIMGTGVPKSYLGLERDVNAKATLEWQDIEFARGIRSDQKEAAGFLRGVYDGQLVALGMPTGKNVYYVEFPAISFVDEGMKMEALKLRWDVAATAKSSLGIPVEWLLEKVVGLGAEDIEVIMADIQPADAMQMMRGMGMGLPTAEPGAKELERVAAEALNSRHIVANLGDLRAKLDAVIEHGLHRTLAA